MLEHPLNVEEVEAADDRCACKDDEEDEYYARHDAEEYHAPDRVDEGALE